ncbi:MAG: hypothetical protein R6W90_03475 [Ignavibacteriaceae bacterium]
MRKFLFSSLFAGALFILTLGFFQVQEALAIGPCAAACYHGNPNGPCYPSSTGLCYCDGSVKVTLCVYYCNGRKCINPDA